MTEDEEVQFKALILERDRLQQTIERAADFLRGELTIRAVNEVARELSCSLPQERHLKDFAWGTATLPQLRAAVREVGFLVGMNWPERPMLLGEVAKDAQS